MAVARPWGIVDLEYSLVPCRCLDRLFGRRRLAVSLLLALIAAVSLTGCETRVVSSTWDQLRVDTHSTSATDLPQQGRFGQRLPQHHNTWTVQVAGFYGADRSDRANQLIQTLTQQDGLNDVWLQGQRGRTSIMVGHFKSPRSGQARQVLAQVRQIQHAGRRPYANAQLVSVVVTAKTYADPYNLKAYHGAYTLQIGFYDGKARRKNAVDAVKSLRKRGVEAYYYQGPHRSLVTVGLFTARQAFVTRKNPLSPPGSTTYVQAYAPAVVKLQQRFPYNLDNGRTINQVIEGKNAGAQSSSLVQVP